MALQPGAKTEARLQYAKKGFMISVLLSLVGTLVEVIIVSIAPSIILLTDLLHWTVDTTLEAIFLLVVYLAGKVGKRFPWSTVIIEGVTVILAMIVILGLYGFFFIDYLSSVLETGSVSTSSLVPLTATTIGGVITLTMYIVQRRNYERYKVELLKVDSTHALIDFVASLLASLGIVLTFTTRSYTVELLFTFISMFFVVHSLIEVFKDTVKTLTGANIDYELRARVRELIMDGFREVEIENVDARKIGSFYVISVKLLVDPDTTMREIHGLRKQIVRNITQLSELVYHVDVKFYPKPAAKTGRFKKRRTRPQRGG